MTNKVKKNVEKAEPKFIKEQILASKKYSNRKDIINTLLEYGKEYSLKEVDKTINDFMKRKVK